MDSTVTASIRRMLGLLAATLLLGGCTGQHTTRTAASTTYTPHIKASSQDVLDGAINADEPGCSAAVGVEGKVIWSGVRGIADLASGAKITTDTVFDIASVSKQFTATAILLLVEAGKLTLDDPISQYVPELPDWAQTVTVEQLMHQTSGIPDYVALLAARGYQVSDRTIEAEARQALAAAPELQFKPGTRFDYSNSNYLLLGRLSTAHRDNRCLSSSAPRSFNRLVWPWWWIRSGRFPTKPCHMRRALVETGPSTGWAIRPGSRSATVASRPRLANWPGGRTTTGQEASAA